MQKNNNKNAKIAKQNRKNITQMNSFLQNQRKQKQKYLRFCVITFEPSRI